MGSDRSVVFKDAHIYKKIKGFGKITIGNHKVAGGMYENTSSNALVFNERPMHNELMNFGNRTGIAMTRMVCSGILFMAEPHCFWN